MPSPEHLMRRAPLISCLPRNLLSLAPPPRPVGTRPGPAACVKPAWDTLWVSHRFGTPVSVRMRALLT